MKSKDLALLLVIGVTSLLLSLFVSNAFLSTPEDRSQRVEVISPIADFLERPDSNYFNAEAINPTQLIKIGEDQNEQPFGEQ